MGKHIRIDDEFNRELQNLLMENERVIWKGKPKLKLSITVLELGFYYDVATGAAGVFGIFLFVIFLVTYLFHMAGNMIGVFLTILIGFILIILPDVIKRERKIHTKYAFSENRVFFRLWRWGKTTYHVIDLLDVGKITYQEYKNKTGIIHFLPKKPLPFFTYDFMSGDRRFYPTFEMIPNAIEVHEQLEALRKERVKRHVLEN